jgi:hypothetical protein
MQAGNIDARSRRPWTGTIRVQGRRTEEKVMRATAMAMWM